MTVRIPAAPRACALALLLAVPTARPVAAGPPPLLPEETVAALAAEVSGTNARQLAQEMTLHHRIRGSEGYRMAAEAVRSQATAYGLSAVEVLTLPADGETFYGTQRSRPAWDADSAELWELAPAGDGEGWRDAVRIASYRLRPVTLAQDSASGEAEADLIDVGAGTEEADYEGLDIRGKLVLTSSQPGAAAPLAVDRFGAAGIVSWAQNQKSAWWGQDQTLVRWGHLETFPEPKTFAFMVSPAQASAWRERLERGERVRLRADVHAGQHPGSYLIPTATIPGADPDLARQEIVFSCHLDHLRPGANDNASGCATILEAGRALSKLVREGKLPPPRRTLRFVWPAEIEGTIALLNARPDLAARARAVIHLDMVGGDPETTKAILHVTRSPASLPTVANDVAEAFARWVNDESYAYAATGRAAYPLVDPEGRRQALQARIAPFSMGSDHQVWTEGSYRVPAIYLNDWPDRTIHTHADRVSNLEPTKLLRAAFIAAASGYTLATLDTGGAAALLDVVRGHSLERTAAALERSRELAPGERANLLRHHLATESEIVRSLGRFSAPEPTVLDRSAAFLDGLEPLVEAALETSDAASAEALPADTGRVCIRAPSPKGPLWGFGYSLLEDRLATLDLPRPALLSYQGRWGGGGEYAYEVLNLVDGRRSVEEVRDAVAAAYGPVPFELVSEYIGTLERIGLLSCRPEARDWAGAPVEPLARRAPEMAFPETALELALAGYAKILCSAVFVSGRDPAEAAANSGLIVLPRAAAADPKAAGIEWHLDHERGEVQASAPVPGAGPPPAVGRSGRRRITRTARFSGVAGGDQGCTILPAGEDRVFFEPTPVTSALPDAATLPWPMGDEVPAAPLPTDVDAERLAAAVDAAFADPEALTAAFLVVHRGRILAERYDLGVGPDTQLESWSMGKSITATLIGRLIQEGAFDLHDPAPIPAWRRPGDPRGTITIGDLLRMSSGLHCVAPRDPDYSTALGYPDHMAIYTGAIDILDFATSRPLEFPPGTEGRYRNCDPLSLGFLIRQEAERRGEEYLTFPQRLLFDQIGIRRQVLEVDPYGGFSLTGFDYGTARNWARLGLLYLREGMWRTGGSEVRLLPEGFTDFVRTKAPAWRDPVYGGLFWLNLFKGPGPGDGLALPRDAYYMAGAGGQYTIVVPSLDLVVVRMGHLRGGAKGWVTLNRALEELTNAIP